MGMRIGQRMEQPTPDSYEFGPLAYLVGGSFMLAMIFYSDSWVPENVSSEWFWGIALFGWVLFRHPQRFSWRHWTGVDARGKE